MTYNISVECHPDKFITGSFYQTKYLLIGTNALSSDKIVQFVCHQVDERVSELETENQMRMLSIIVYAIIFRLTKMRF